MGRREMFFAVRDDQLSPQRLVDYLCSELRNGNRFEAEQTIQIGWMITRLVESDDGRLELREPEFGAIPIQWKRGMDNTLTHLAIQRAVCETVGCEPSFPSIRQSGITYPTFTKDRGFKISRDNSSGTSSGWTFVDQNCTEEESRLQSLFEIANVRIDVVPYLALPAGTVIIKRADLLGSG